MAMLGHVGRQAAQYVLVLLLALLVNFALPRAMPGSPLRALGGGDVGLLSAADRAELLAQYGLDRPLVVQFRDYVAGLAQLDLGRSFADGRAVTAVLGERVGWTLLLVGSGLVLATLLGGALGTLSAARRERGRDTGTVATFVALDAMPAFWTGMLLILAFSVQLGWLPTFGATPLAGAAPGLAGLVDIGRHLILPLITLVLAGVAQMFLVTRSSMMSVLGSGYLFLARAKGLPRGRVLVRHGMRTAALPVTTLFLLEIGALVEGAVVVETVFAYPGLGRLMYEAVLARDFPVLQGGFLVLTVAVIGMNLLADLCYPLLDPRVRRSTAEVA